MKSRQSYVPIRILLDSGCSCPIIAESTASRLNLGLEPCKEVPILGLRSEPVYARSKATIFLKFRLGTFKISFQALVVPNASGWPATTPLIQPYWLHKLDPLLADPDIVKPSTVLIYDILVGGDFLAEIRLTPIYFHREFALQSSLGGYVPRGRWSVPEDATAPRLFEPSITARINQVPRPMVKLETITERYETLLHDSSSEEDNNLNRLIAESILQDRLDLLGDSEKEKFIENEQNFLQYLKTLTYDETGRVIAPLPKKPGYPDNVSENLITGRWRIRSVEKLLENPVSPYAQEYIKMFMSWVQTGVLRKTSLSELREHGKFTELPHHPVLRPDSKTTPVRMVIDGNAKDFGKTSTNDFLDSGINVLPQIINILTTARVSRQFIMGDISKAFLQIKLAPEDRYLLVFRWPVKKPDGKYSHEFYRFERLPWGINCAPYILNAVIRFLYREFAKNNPQYKETMMKMEANSYVDDILITGENSDETAELAILLKSILEKGHFLLTKFRSFPPDLTERLGTTPTLEDYKILGIIYHPTSDSFSASVEKISQFRELKQITKRQAAGIVSRIYDPLGLVSPVSLLAKFLRQILDQDHPKAEWSFKLPPARTEEWHKFVDDAQNISEICFPRRITLDDETEREYHIFSDASDRALGVAIYCVSKNTRDEDLSNIMAGKAKIHPVAKLKVKRSRKKKDPNEITLQFLSEPKDSGFQINRMELNAALLGVKLFSLLQKDLDPTTPVFYWTDSEVTLRWINKGPCTGTAFVDARIKKILEKTNVGQWRHTPGEDNPADIASRGLSANELKTCSLWLHGPTWLTNHELWPRQPVGIATFIPEKQKNSENQSEPLTMTDSPTLWRPFLDSNNFPIPSSMENQPVEAEMTESVVTLTAIPGGNATPSNPPKPAESDYMRQIPCKGTFSLEVVIRRYVLLLRIQRWYREYVSRRLHRLRSNTHQVQSTPIGQTLVSYSEQQEALRALIRDNQRLYAAEYWNAFQDNPDVVIDGLTWNTTFRWITSRSRQHYNVKDPTDFTARELIFIPYSRQPKDGKRDINPLAELLSIQAHEKTGHGSENHILCYIRQLYWIPKARKLAKWCRNLCPNCRRLTIQPYKLPEAPLPTARTKGNSVFEAIGVDFVGPFQCLRGTTEKISFAVFSCALTRAIIIRPCTRQTATEFRSEFNTICNEYSLQPKFIFSDRATAFKTVARSTRHLNQFNFNENFVWLTECYADFSKHMPAIVWRHNASRAPWWGGFYERMMALIKDKIARIFRGHEFSSFTIIREAVSNLTSIINSRPITWGGDLPDSSAPITPGWFLFGRPNYTIINPMEIIPTIPKFEAASAEELKKTILERRKFYVAIWNSFHHEYLFNLRARRTEKATKEFPLIKPGQVVLYQPGNVPGTRGARFMRKWRLARVVSVFQSPRDGLVRSVTLEIWDGKSPMEKPVLRTLESQSIERIAPLEVDLSDAEHEARLELLRKK